MNTPLRLCLPAVLVFGLIVPGLAPAHEGHDHAPAKAVRHLS